MTSRLTIQELIQKDYERKVKTFLSLPLEGKDVMVGDSMIAYLNLHHYQMDDWINQGIAGDTTTGVLKRIDAITRLKPKRVIVSIGSNDLVLTQHTPEMIISNMKTILEILGQSSLVYLCLITPVNPIMKDANHAYIAGRTNKDIIMLNQRLKEIFTDHVIDVHTPLLDEQGLLNERLSKDGIHLNHEGYHLFLKSIKNRLR